MKRPEGFTRHIIAENFAHHLDVWVHPDADLDGQFRAYDPSTDSTLMVTGWMMDIKDYA